MFTTTLSRVQNCFKRNIWWLVFLKKAVLRRIHCLSCYFTTYYQPSVLRSICHPYLSHVNNKITFSPSATSYDSFADTRPACISVTGDEYCTLLRHIYKFFWRVAAGSGKSADPILHHAPPLLNIVAMRGENLKIKEVLAYLSLDLISNGVV
jgi:hypothetical protein